MTCASLLFSQFTLSPLFFFSSSLAFSLSRAVFLSVAFPEQISALKCLLQLVSLTPLIILRSHDNSPLVSHLEFISFFSSSSLSTLEEKKKSSQERAIFLFKKKSWKCFWCSSPPIRNSHLGLLQVLFQRTLMHAANKANPFQYHIVWDRNDHYTLCVWISWVLWMAAYVLEEGSIFTISWWFSEVVWTKCGVHEGSVVMEQFVCLYLWFIYCFNRVLLAQSLYFWSTFFFLGTQNIIF